MMTVATVHARVLMPNSDERLIPHPISMKTVGSEAINASAAELGYFSMASMALCICTMQAFISFFCIMS